MEIDGVTFSEVFWKFCVHYSVPDFQNVIQELTTILQNLQKTREAKFPLNAVKD